jgi:sugar lactone lactonase YvrE
MTRKISIFIFVLTSLICTSQNIYTYAGIGLPGFSGDGGAANLAKINFPIGVAVDASGNLFISDYANHRIRKVNTSGIISTVAGTGTQGFSGDGGLAVSALLNHPSGIAVDNFGNIYFSDEDNNRVRMINNSGVINTVAGGGTTLGDGGPAISAQLSYPYGIAIDNAGSLYIADQLHYRIRKVNTSGIINTVAGTGTAGLSGNGGQATLAQINQASGVAIDPSGNIYLTEMQDNQIRKINTSGVINTIAGTGISGFAGDGGPAISAQLSYPTNISIDATGNIYINDMLNYRIRKINSLGNISTVVGTGTSGYSGDYGSAISAQIGKSWATSIDMSGNLYINDYDNHCVRIVCATNCITGMNANTDKTSSFSIFPNPNNGIFSLKVENEIKNGEIVLINSLGQEVYRQRIFYGENTILTYELAQGLYTYIILQNKEQLQKSKLTIE